MTLDTTIIIVGIPAKPAPTKSIGPSAASPTGSGRISMNTSSSSIGNGVMLIRGATKVQLNAQACRNQERGAIRPAFFFSMRFKLPRFLRSEAVGRDRAQLPGFETIELSQVGIAQGDSERAVGLAVDARRESVLAVTDQLGHGGVQKQVNAEFLLVHNGHVDGFSIHG